MYEKADEIICSLYDKTNVKRDNADGDEPAKSDEDNAVDEEEE